MPISFFLCGQNVTESSYGQVESLDDSSNKPSTNLVQIRIPNDVTYLLQVETTAEAEQAEPLENEGNEHQIDQNKQTKPLTSYDLSHHSQVSSRFFPTFIRKISCGSDFLVVLLNDGSLYSMGANSHGQLGVNLSDFSINTFPKKQLVQVKLPENTNVKLVECGAHFTLFATTDNRLFGFGTNDYNQIFFQRANLETSGTSTNDLEWRGDFMEPFEIDYHRKEGQDEM